MTTIQINDRITAILRVSPYTPAKLEECCHVETRLTVNFEGRNFPLSVFLNYRDGINELHRLHFCLAGDEPSSKLGISKGHLEWFPEDLRDDLTEEEKQLILKAGWENMPTIVHENFKLDEDYTLTCRDSGLTIDKGARPAGLFSCGVVKL